MMKDSEPLGEAFTRNHLVVSMHHTLVLEVRGMKVGLSSMTGRKI